MNSNSDCNYASDMPLDNCLFFFFFGFITLHIATGKCNPNDNTLLFCLVFDGSWCDFTFRFRSILNHHKILYSTRKPNAYSIIYSFRFWSLFQTQFTIKPDCIHFQNCETIRQSLASTIVFFCWLFLLLLLFVSLWSIQIRRRYK